MEHLYTERSRTLTGRVRDFIAEHILPIEADYLEDKRSADNPWTVTDEVEALKEKARAAGLWNLFLPDETVGAGLSTLEYAPLAEEMGRSFLAPEIFNCNAPDTGNMEVLYHFGSEEQKTQYLQPLLAGDIRSAFCMTEPDVASSDATNMQATVTVEGDQAVINGRKWWSTGIGHPNCRFVIFMGLTDPDANRHSRHSMIIVPMDTPGVRLERMLPVFGEYDAPYGHGEISFTDVRVPVGNFIGGPGQGFAIAQGRLGPGRIHHCMRALGAAERALEMMCRRALEREAFGKPLASLGGNRERIAEARMSIDQARLLTLNAAAMIDRVGARAAMSEIAQIKVIAPRVAQRVIDDTIQIFGAAGLSNDLPLTALYAYARSLRIADGPDAVHQNTIARTELRRYQ